MQQQQQKDTKVEITKTPKSYLKKITFCANNDENYVNNIAFSIKTNALGCDVIH